jgi:acyl-CoA thioesterase-1
MFSDMLQYLPAPPPSASPLIVRAGERIVALGDSITEAEGYLRAIDAVFARQYPHLRLPPIINAGIGGNKAADMLGRFTTDVLAHRPDRITIHVGINDVWHNLHLPDDDAVLRAYRADVARMVDLAKANGSRVMLLTPTVIEERADSLGNLRLARYVAAMRRIAAQAACDLCDLHALFLAALAARPATATPYWLTVDGVHMSPRGDAVMAIGILRALGVTDAAIAATRLCA